MEAGNPFSEMPATPESIIAQVRKQLGSDYPEVLATAPGVLDQSAESVVRDLWQGRVKTFIPVLALREARELLRERESLIPALHLDAMPGQPDAAGRQPVRDAMRIDHDVLTLDGSDVLRL